MSKKEAYEKLSGYLNETGAPSHIWSLLEKIYEPNGVFLKQRKRIAHLKEALRAIAQHNTLDGEKYNNPYDAYDGVVEYAQKALKEVFGE